MLKFEIDSLEGLDESLHGFYEQHGEKYRLKVEGIDPADELKEALRKEREERRAAKERAEELERKAQQAAEEAAKRSGDTEALDRSWNEKYTKALGEKDQTLTALQAQVHALTVGATAARLAGELAVQGSSAVLQRLIEPRLSMDMRDGKPVVVVLDNEGRPTALTPDELKNEIISDAALAPLVAGSKATGGGAAGSKGGGAAKTWDQLSGMERVELRRTNPAEHARLKAAAGQ